MRKPWSEEMKDLIVKGYKFNDKDECIFDPTLPLPTKTAQVVAQGPCVEPRTRQVAKKGIVSKHKTVIHEHPSKKGAKK